MLPGNVRGHRLTSSRASGRNTIAAFALSIALGGARCGGIRRRNKNGNHNSHLKNGVTNARSSLCHIAMKTRIKNAKMQHGLYDPFEAWTIPPLPDAHPLFCYVRTLVHILSVANS